VKFYLEDSEHHVQRKGKPEFFGKRGLDPALFAQGVAMVKQAGIATTVHVRSAADFRLAIHAGVDEITHLPLEPITAADAAAVARAGITVVTTMNSHRPAPADAAGIHKDNLALLKQAGVKLVAGTDNGGRALLQEMHALGGTGVFTMSELIHITTTAPAQYLFPRRKLGKLEDGYEASFIAFAGNPLRNPPTLMKVVYAVKQGKILKLEPLPPPQTGHVWH
jgi:imidazolonepropionase-like amidohydrolase